MNRQILLLLMILLPMMASADYSGNCGNNVNYMYIEATQTLIVSGNGDISNYSQGESPWYSFRTQIRHIIVESGVKTIGNFAFCDCQNVESVSLSEGLEYIKACAFSQCGMIEMTEIIIPNSVVEIQSEAFWWCRALDKVILGKGLITIGSNAFQNTLTNKVYCFATTPPNIASNSFDNRHVLYVPQESINTYKTAPEWKDFDVILSIPDEAGIQANKNAQNSKTIKYNLSGVRLSKLQKGVNVVNSKKIVSK